MLAFSRHLAGNQNQSMVVFLQRSTGLPTRSRGQPPSPAPATTHPACADASASRDVDLAHSDARVDGERGGGPGLFVALVLYLLEACPPLSPSVIFGGADRRLSRHNLSLRRQEGERNDEYA